MGGAGVAAPGPVVPAPEARPAAGGSPTGPQNVSMSLNISGAGLTPDELMSRARAEFGRMIENL